jgi:hypothetical protein
MVEQATVDAYGDDEQQTGLFTMLEEHLALPFTTRILGVDVTVRGVDLVRNDIVAVCQRGRERQLIPILNLPSPDPRPAGADWIEAYRYWASGR